MLQVLWVTAAVLENPMDPCAEPRASHAQVLEGPEHQLMLSLHSPVSC